MMAVKSEQRARWLLALELKEAGVTFVEIGKQFGCNKQRAFALVKKGRKERLDRIAQGQGYLTVMEHVTTIGEAAFESYPEVTAAMRHWAELSRWNS